MTPVSAASEVERPTRIRWRIAGLLLIIITLTFIDRFNMNVAAKYIQQEFALTDIQVGGLLSAFVLGYALFQIPGGLLGDRFGPRRVLIGAILWWSVWTALTAAAPALSATTGLGVFASFWLVRFLIGIGEGPAFPNANKVVGMWMSPLERARGSGFFILGVGIGGTLTPPVIAWIMLNWGWRLSFLICGALGIVVTALWTMFSTETPREHKGINRAELDLIGPPVTPGGSKLQVPWARIFGNRTVLALMLSNFLLGYVSYIFYTWFYLYVVNVRKLPMVSGSYWSTVPFMMMLIAAPLGGIASDAMVRRFGHPWGRRIPVMAAALTASVLLTVGARITDPYVAISVLSVAGGCNTFIAVTCWALPNDLSRKFSGSLSGVLNMSNNLGGAISPILTPAIAMKYGWTTALDIAAVVIFCSGTLWLLINAAARIDTDGFVVRNEN
jgi:ACS family glucarate transporter-like MFS transporter